MKKIFSILGGMFMLILLTGFVIASYTDVFNSDNTVIIYGSNAAASDIVGADDINKGIVGEIIITTTTVLGKESILIQSHGDDLNFKHNLNDVITKFTYKDLPSILADGEVERHDGSDEEYTQVLKFGDNQITFNSLDEDDYVINTNYSSKEKPLIYLDLSGELWNLEIEFDDSLDVTDLDDDATIVLAGREYTFKPDMEDDDNELVLFASSEKISIELDVEKTITLDGKSITLKLIGANNEDDDNDEAFIMVNNEFEKVKEGEVFVVNGQKIYINDIFIRNIPDNKVTVELFIGADELSLDVNNGFNTVELNGDSLDGMEAEITGDIDAIERIVFRFSPTDMEDIEDEIQYLEVGESITDPLFKTISMVLESVDTELDSEDRDLIEVKALRDELEITFINVDGNEIEFVPYYVNSSDDLVLSLVKDKDDVKEEEIFIVQVSGDITEIFRIEDINSNEVEIYSYTEDEDKDYDNGDELENTNVIVNIVNGTLSFDIESSDILWSENLMKIELGNTEISFDEEMDDDENPIRTVLTTEISVDTNGDIEIGGITGDNITQASDDNGNFEYTVTDGFATYFVREAEDNSYLKVYVPAEETDFNVYVSDSVIQETTEEVGISLTMKDTDEGTDDDAEKNLIIVGGPCINEVAADLLDSFDPVCGEAFTDLTGVNAGEYLYQVFEHPKAEDKVIVLIAGYHAEDTARGVNEFLEGDFDLIEGTKLIK